MKNMCISLTSKENFFVSKVGETFWLMMWLWHRHSVASRKGQMNTMNWVPQGPSLLNARGWIQVVPWSFQSHHRWFITKKASSQRADRSPVLYAGGAAGTKLLLFCYCLRSLCVLVDIYNPVCFRVSVLSPKEHHFWYNSSGMHETQVSCEWQSHQGRYVTSCICYALFRNTLEKITKLPSWLDLSLLTN